jgi:hypothetical protein
VDFVVYHFFYYTLLAHCISLFQDEFARNPEFGIELAGYVQIYRVIVSTLKAEFRNIITLEIIISYCSMTSL